MIVPRKYQTFWPRFWAGWIDIVLILPSVFVLDRVGHSAAHPVVLGSCFVLKAFALDGYTILMHGKYGQTIGKMVTGVKVLDGAESNLSWKQALLRNIVPLVLIAVGLINSLPRAIAGHDFSYAGNLALFGCIELYAWSVWFAAELTTMLLSPKRRAVHDLIAGSVVVRLEEIGAPSGGNSIAV